MTECEIQTVAFGGEGVAKVDGFVLFVPFTLPKERVQVKITEKKARFARASLEKVLEPNPHRIQPPCPYFTVCGGCQLQHADYLEQLNLKRRFVEDAFTRIGKLSFPIPPVIASSTSFGYRRHITLQLEYLENHWSLGFASQTGSFLPVNACLLFHELGDPILSHIEQALTKLPRNLPGRLKILKKEPGYVLAFSFPYSLEEATLSFFSSLAENSLFMGVIIQTPDKQYSWKKPSLECSYSNLSFSYSPFSFIQNHAEQSEKIYLHVVSLLSSSHKILDLYCGIGVTSLLLATLGKQVLGIEINPIAISYAKENANKNGCNPDIFLCESAEKALSYIASFEPDAILVNPPKTGVSPSVLKAIQSSLTNQIIYISCHPPTLARDAKILVDNGFALNHVQSFDMFPQTTHVETVAVFNRKKSK